MAQGAKTGGRTQGTPNKATAEVRDLALKHGPAALEELARLSTEAQSETARISACTTILERAYGKAHPGRPIVIDLPDTSSIEGVTKAVAHVVQTAARGEITAAEASEFCGLLESQRRVVELSEMERRLAILEKEIKKGGSR